MVDVQHGPLSLQIAVPNLVTPALKFETFREFLVNTAPKAGQHWAIENVYFSFPLAFKAVEAAVSESVEFELEIAMFIGSLEVASQKFLELGQRGEAEGAFHAQGSLEPFIPATVFPGQAINFKIRVATNNTLSSMGTGQGGKMIMSYSLYGKS